MPRQASDNLRNSCLFVKSSLSSKYCAEVLWFAGFCDCRMFWTRLHVCQVGSCTNTKQGGCSRSEQLTHGWLQSEPPAASTPSHWPLILFSASHFWDFSLSSTGLFCFICVWVKKEYLPDTIKNMYLNLLIGMCNIALLVTYCVHLALVRLHWSNALHSEKVI